MRSPAKSFIFSVHAHQPVGNFNHVFSDAYEKSYKPFFEVLEAHPSISASCHFSGSLIDWLEEAQPAFLERLRKLSDRGQVEWMGGAYYEPIYGVIPKKDLAGQIAMMRAKLKTLFGAEPEGAWLAERVWDPDLVKPLQEAGVAYTVLDDSHFQKAGITPPVVGYYRAKNSRPPLDFFASMKQLRYLMPFRRPEETIEFIRSTETGPDGALVFADDCEKFGMWPGTFHWVYREKWLDKLFTLLEKEKGIATHTFSGFRKRFAPKRPIRVAHGSYAEMMDWSGGSFYRFFDKYAESRYMRDRMWNTSAALAKKLSRNGTHAHLEKAKEALYKAQCNCSYWHGVFGGLYLHHLRSAVFENLIRADCGLLNGRGEAAPRGGAEIRSEKFASGPRWRIRQRSIVSFFNPRYGAALEELDFLPKSVNLTCNLRRYKEPYHDAVLKKTSSVFPVGPLSIHQMLGVKDPDLERHLHYDAFRRLSFMDHFLESEASLEEFATSAYRDVGNFADGLYRVKKETNTLCFKKKGFLRLDSKKIALSLSKAVSPRGDAGLSVCYTLRNDTARRARFVFAVELNFSIGEQAAMRGLDEKNVAEWTLRDSWRGLAIHLSAPGRVRFLATPVETVSESESGLEKTYQQLAIFLQKEISLEPRESKEQAFGLEVRADWTGS